MSILLIFNIYSRVSITQTLSIFGFIYLKYNLKTLQGARKKTELSRILRNQGLELLVYNALNLP